MQCAIGVMLASVEYTKSVATSLWRHSFVSQPSVLFAETLSGKCHVHSAYTCNFKVWIVFCCVFDI